MPECKNCIHIEVCKSADSCDGRVPGCRHFETKTKNGRWLYYSTTMQECSNCQRHTARHKFKYCPHCGVVMEDKYNDG